MTSSHSHKCKICKNRFCTEKLFDLCMCPECQKLFNDPKGFLKSKTPYKTVEEVMQMPVIKRWTWSKWWSLSEHLKARKIVHRQEDIDRAIERSVIDLRSF